VAFSIFMYCLLCILCFSAYMTNKRVQYSTNCWQSVHPSVYVSVCLSVCLYVCVLSCVCTTNSFIHLCRVLSPSARIVKATDLSSRWSCDDTGTSPNGSRAPVNGRTGILYPRKFDQNDQNYMARRIRVRPK